MSTGWSELNPRDKSRELPEAVKRQIAPGQVRYVFVHDDLEVDNPTLDASGRYFVSPREYGFSIRGFIGGKTAWARDFSTGTMLVVNADGQSHVLSPKLPARILFVGHDGAVLQDTGNAELPPVRVPDLTTVRLTINATFDLHGESPEMARTLLMRMVDRAVLIGPRPGESQAVVVDHMFESSAVVGRGAVGEPRRASDTDFSQLLDI
ncbi:MAG TPA: hypothetical protein PKH72_01615 [Rhodoferax sp.]|nr:hypothetical protein [Rhodoferax sp.]HNV58328.1 hypothetical protein [Rhodoferax sp.]HPW27917.1 hypothetical protein [Rhodoferax sp.]